MSNNHQQASLDDALTFMETGRRPANNNMKNYYSNKNSNDYNSNPIKYAPSRPSPLKQSVNNNKHHANNVGAPFVFGKHNDNQSDNVSVFKTIQTNSTTRPTEAGHAAFLSFFDGPPKGMDEIHTNRRNNGSGMGFNNSSNPGFEAAIGGPSQHTGIHNYSNNTTSSAFPRSAFNVNNTGNSSTSLTNDNNNNSVFGSAFTGSSNSNSNNFNNTSAFGYNKPFGNNTGGSNSFNTNTSSPFGSMDCTDNSGVGSAFGASPTGSNNLFNKSNTNHTASPYVFPSNEGLSVGFTNETNSGFGSAFGGSTKPNSYGNFNATPTPAFGHKQSPGKNTHKAVTFAENTPSNTGLPTAFNGAPKRSAFGHKRLPGGNDKNATFVGNTSSFKSTLSNNADKPGIQSASDESTKSSGINNNIGLYTTTQTIPGFGKNRLGKQKDIQKRLLSSLGDENDDSSSSGNFTSSQRKKNSTKEDRAARFGSTNKTATYDEMKQNRIEERRLAIENGTIPDPNAPTRLEDAIDFRGTCTTMCPEFEMVERDLQNGLDPLEMDKSGNVDPNKAVKTYRRSAAGNEQPLPSDVRPPSVLIKTLDYLMGTILIQQPLERCHPFLRDRTRSIRQDFTLQNIRDESAVIVHERIARFHILCLHEMCELDEERFSEQQETEQLRKVLLSLIEFYEDLREEGLEMENEPEFRAYHLISHIRDPDAVNKLQTLPKHLFLHPYVQRALEFYGLIQRNNEIMETSSRRNKPENVQASQNFYTQFFKLVRDPGTPFLMACMLEWHFSNVRKGALKAMNAAHRQAGVDVEFLRRNLGYDTPEMVIEDAQVYGLVVSPTPSGPVVRFHQKNSATGKGVVFIEPLSDPKQRKSLLLVDPKKDGLSLQDIVNGTNTIPPARRTSIPEVPSIARSAPHNKQHPFTTQQNTPKATSRSIMNDPIHHQQKQQWKIPEEEDQPSLQQQEQQKQQRLLAENVKKRQEEIDIQIKADREKIQQLEAAKREKQERERIQKELKQQQEREQQQQVIAAMAQEKKRLEREQLEADQKAKQAALLKEIEIKNRRRAVIHSQVKKRLTNQLATAVVEESVTQAIKTMHRNHNLAKRYSKSWLRRARERISTRHSKSTRRVQQYHFSSFFCPSGQKPCGNINTIHPSPKLWNDNNTASLHDAICERATLALELENSALSSNNTPQTSLPQGLWDTVDYADSIYPLIRSKWDRIRARMEETEDRARPGWQLWINVADSSLPSSQWFKAKFGLDDAFSRNVKYFEDCRITIRSIKNQDINYGKAVDELGAVIFSLSEIRHDNDDDIHTIQHWKDEQERLKDYAATLKHYNPQICVPFVFTYWPGTTALMDMLIKIPKLLDLENIDVISDFHILLMNPLTIKDRLDQELNWLSANSIINQPLKVDIQAILKMRALVVAVEKTTCHFKVGEVTLTEAINLANKKIQTYNKHLVDVPFNWTPFVVPAIPEQPMGDRTATGDDLLDLGCMWVDQVAKKRVIEPVKGGAENLGAVVEGILKLHMYELERRLERPIVSFV